MGAILPPTLKNIPGLNAASVADFGAVGDGVTDDTTALQAAFASGRNLYFNTGATYIVSGQMAMQNNQTVFGNYATLQNVNQISDTTNTNITTGASSFNITVTNGSKWKVGQSITVYDGSNFDGSNHLIASINGNVLTVGTAFSKAFPTGGTVYLTYYNILTNNNNRINDLQLNGNKANWTFYRWQNTGGFEMLGTNSLIDNPRLTNMPGEGIVIYGTDNKVRDVKGDNINGNGIHFSGATRPRVDGVIFNNVNLDTSVGHANGGVIWSNGIVDARVHDVYVNGGITAIGSIDSYDNSDITVSKVIARNCTQAGVGMNASSAYSAPVRISLSDIKTYSCPYGLQITSDIAFALTVSGATNASPIALTTSVNHNISDGQPVLVWAVTGNTGANGTWYAKATGNAANVVTLYQDSGLTVPVAGNGSYVSGGSILAQVSHVSLNGIHCYDSTTNNITLNNVRSISGSNIQCIMKGGSTSVVNISISDCQNVSLTGVVVKGGTYGCYVQSPNGNQRNVNINGNAFDGQYNAGISMITASQASTMSTTNVISADSTAVSTYDGIVMGNKSAADGNYVYVPANVPAIHSGISMGSGGSASLNKVQTPSSSYKTILMSGGTVANMAMLNATSSAPQDNNSSNQTNMVGLNFDPWNNSMNGLIPQSVDSATTTTSLANVGPTGSPLTGLAVKGSGTVGISKHFQGITGLSSSSAGSQAGSGATVSTNTFSDNIGSMTITTGTGSSAGQLAQVVCQFSGNNLQMLLTPMNAASAGIQAYATQDDTVHTLSVRCATAPADGTVYKFSYFIFQAA